jgi:hypothetical protein
VPVVPTYRNQPLPTERLQGPRIDSTPPQGALGLTEASAQGFKASSGLAETVQKIAMEEKNKGDQIAVQDYDTKASDLQTKLQIEASQMKGKDAAAAIDLVQQKWTEGLSSLDGTLNNDSQRFAARHAAQQRWESLNKSVQLHSAQQLEQYDAESTDASISNARDQAILNYHDPEEVQNGLAKQNEALIYFAQRNGKGEEWLKSKLEESESKTHVGIVQRMLANGEDQRASQYYKGIKDQVSGADATTLEKYLEEGSLRGQSQRMADELLKDPEVTMISALEKAREVQDPKLRDALSDRLKSEFANRETARRNDEEKLFENVSRVVEQSKSRDQIPVDQWLALSPQARSSVDARIAQLRKGVEPETDPSLYYNLKTQAATPELKNQFLQTNLLLVRPHLSDSDWKEMVNIQTSLRSKDGKADAELDGFRNNQSIVNDTLNQIGIDPTPKTGSDDAGKVNLFRQKVDEQVRAIQQTNGRKATNEEVQTIVDRLATKVVTDRGWLWNSHKRAFEVNDTNPIDVDTSEIPRAERQKIEDALRSHKLPVTDEAVRSLYVRRLQGDLGGRR